MILRFVLLPLLGGKAGEIIVLTEAPGLVESTRAVSALLMKLRLNPAVQEQALYWARNIAFLLNAALDEPLHTAWSFVVLISRPTICAGRMRSSSPHWDRSGGRTWECPRAPLEARVPPGMFPTGERHAVATHLAYYASVIEVLVANQGRDFGLESGRRTRAVRAKGTIVSSCIDKGSCDCAGKT